MYNDNYTYYIYKMTDINNNLKRITKIYIFKSFKKNLKFKKYRIGITSFVTNRKKYFLKKRNTNFLVKFNISSIWSKNYLKYKQYNRFVQFINITNFTLSFINLNFFKKKTILKGLFFNINTISKRIYFKLPFKNFDNISLKNNNKLIFLNLCSLPKKRLNLGQFKYNSYLYNNSLDITLVISYKNLINMLLFLSILNVVSIYKIFIFLTTLNNLHTHSS